MTILISEKTNMRRMESYLTAIDHLTGRANPACFKISEQPQSLYVAQFLNTPVAGCSTAFSCGLSARQHSDWVNASAELLICVNSLDDSWGLAMGDVIARSAADWSFAYGTVIRFGEIISDESKMTDFVVYKNCLYSDEQSFISLGTGRVHLSQLYPVYAEEFKTIQKKGIQEFFSGDLMAFCDVKRQPIVS